jgi:YfiH family protein
MWKLDHGAPLPLWRPEAPDPEFVLAFTTRRGGVSSAPYDSLNLGRSTPDEPDAVLENRRRVLDALSIAPSSLVTAGQVHGATVRRAEAAGHVPECDALVTRHRGLALAITTADCMPLLYAAPGTVAVAHSGWRGTAEGMPVTTLEAVRAAAEVVADQVAVHLGPCIRGCCYEVGPEVARRFPAAAVTSSGDRFHLDLPTAARLQLIQAGVKRIEDVGVCTACESYWYFSHRRDHGLTGRHWAVAALRDSRTGRGV